MRPIALTVLFLAVVGFLNAQTIKRVNNSSIKADSLTRCIKRLAGAAHVDGIQVAIFNNNKTVYKKAFGYKRADTKDTLTTFTNVYGASLSKSVFAVLVLRLVEKGVLDLDKPLQQYLPKPIYEYKPQTRWHDNYADLKTDTLYQKVTARMCLDHTSGFPNWRWNGGDNKLKIFFEPGTRYSYSGEGMVYLQVVLEKLTGKSLQQMADEEIFKPAGIKNSAYTFLDRFDADYVSGHDANGKVYEKDKDNEARAPSTLETTMDDLCLFIEAVMQGKLLKSSSTKMMFSPQVRIRSIAQFGPMALKDNNVNDDIQLSYGLGWGLLKSPYGWAAFKEGHGDGFQHYCILFPDKKTGVLIVTNSDNGESVFKELLETSISDVYTPWSWENYIPYNMSK